MSESVGIINDDLHLRKYERFLCPKTTFAYFGIMEVTNTKQTKKSTFDFIGNMNTKDVL